MADKANLARVCELAHQGDKGICTECGVKAPSIASKARKHKCSTCGANKAYVALGLLLSL